MPTQQARTDTVRRTTNQAMSEHQLVGFLGRKIYQAMNDEDGDLSDTRQDSFDRYLGDLYGNEREGYSKFTTREVLETIEWVLPSILRVFVGSERMVAFEPVGQEDEEQADQETDVVNYKIWRANDGDGFLAVHHFIKDALLYPNAYVKAYVDEQEKITEHKAVGISSFQLLEIMEDEANTITAQSSRTIQAPVEDEDMAQIAQAIAAQTQTGTPPGPSPQAGPAQATEGPGPMPPAGPGGAGTLPPELSILASQQLEVFDIEYKRKETVRKLKIEAVPGEEALIDNDCTSTNIDTADFSAHRVRKSYTELVQMGYSQEKLNTVGNYEDFQWNDERTNRLFYEDEDPDAEDEDDASMRRFWVHECTAWVDFDGDGIAEFRRIVLIGNVVFENEVVDYQPLVAMSSILLPHKHNGLSFADIIKDLQELKTTLTRQMLDNIYKINIRRKIISEDSLLPDGTTLEQMLDIQAEWIPVQGAAANAIMSDQTQSLTGEILPVLQHLDERTANRSGINPQVNLNPDVLQQSTFGAFMGAMEQASQRVEMLVRIMAETGIKQLMRKVHYLIRSYPDIATTIKLRGKWVDVDPQGWRERTDVKINVGLGFNNKQQMLGLLSQLLAEQKEAVASGLASEREVFNTYRKMVEYSGIGEVTQYFKDPSMPGWQPPQQQPDPAAILAEAQAQAVGQEQQRKAAEAQHKAQMELEKSRLEGEKLAAELDQRERELMLKEREMALKEREMELNAIDKAGKIQADADAARAKERETEASADLKDEQAVKTYLEGEVIEKQLANGTFDKPEGAADDDKAGDGE